MIVIKNKLAIEKMATAGKKVAEIMQDIEALIEEGVTTAALDQWVMKELQKKQLLSATIGYMGYKHATCISINEEVVHGVPSISKKLQAGDLVKVDLSAFWKGYCADMARSFFVGNVSDDLKLFVVTAQNALDQGIQKACVGNRLTDISAAIEQEVNKKGYGILRDFAGHGIGKQLHEDPEILNYGKAGQGPVLRHGMTFAIEPMITLGAHQVCVDKKDGWTVRTLDGKWGAHVEDTVVVTDNGPLILTRL